MAYACCVLIVRSLNEVRANKTVHTHAPRRFQGVTLAGISPLAQLVAVTAMASQCALTRRPGRKGSLLQHVVSEAAPIHGASDHRWRLQPDMIHSRSLGIPHKSQPYSNFYNTYDPSGPSSSSQTHRPQRQKRPDVLSRSMHLVVQLCPALREIGRRTSLFEQLCLSSDVFFILRTLWYGRDVHDGRVALTVMFLFDSVYDVGLPKDHITRMYLRYRNHGVV